MPFLIDCPVCERGVSTEAVTCPSCGQPDPFAAYKVKIEGESFEAIVKTAAEGHANVEILHAGLEGVMEYPANRPLKAGMRISVCVLDGRGEPLRVRRVG